MASGRRWFVLGAWAWIAVGVFHLLGHVQMLEPHAQNETEAELLRLMTEYKMNLPGSMRSMMDLLLGFSLTFTILPIGMGILDLVVARHLASAPGLLRQACAVSLVAAGTLSALSLYYWFAIPTTFLLATTFCFGIGLLASPRS